MVQPAEQERSGRTRPFTDEEALKMLRGDQNSRAFVREYEGLRAEGMGVGQALIFVGHKFGLSHLDYQTAR